MHTQVDIYDAWLCYMHVFHKFQCIQIFWMQSEGSRVNGDKEKDAGQVKSVKVIMTNSFTKHRMFTNYLYKGSF